jgi:hypothetical protein
MKGFLDMLEKFICLSLEMDRTGNHSFALVEFGFITANQNLNFKGSMGSRMESCSKEVIYIVKPILVQKAFVWVYRV